jgi:DNA-binding response OmpR family regulator
MSGTCSRCSCATHGGSSTRPAADGGWGPAYRDQTNYLRVYMATLRRKLEDDAARPRHLLTEPGRGYRFEP